MNISFQCCEHVTRAKVNTVAVCPIDDVRNKTSVAIAPQLFPCISHIGNTMIKFMSSSAEESFTIPK